MYVNDRCFPEFIVLMVYSWFADFNRHVSQERNTTVRKTVRYIFNFVSKKTLFHVESVTLNIAYETGATGKKRWVTSGY